MDLNDDGVDEFELDYEGLEDEFKQASASADAKVVNDDDDEDDEDKERNWRRRGGEEEDKTPGEYQRESSSSSRTRGGDRGHNHTSRHHNNNISSRKRPRGGDRHQPQPQQHFGQRNAKRQMVAAPPSGGGGGRGWGAFHQQQMKPPMMQMGRGRPMPMMQMPRPPRGGGRGGYGARGRGGFSMGRGPPRPMHPYKNNNRRSPNPGDGYGMYSAPRPSHSQQHVARPPRSPPGGGAQYQQTSCTVMVSNVPAKQCTIGRLAGHFGRFGEVVNIKVHPDQQRAFVQFGSQKQAAKAFRHPQPVFNNRFIEVSWAPDQSGPAGAAVLKASGGDGGGVKGKQALSGDKMKWEAPEVTRAREEAKRKKKIKILAARKNQSEAQLSAAEKTLKFTQGTLKAKREKIGNLSEQISLNKAILMKLIAAKKKGKKISTEEKSNAMKQIKDLTLSLKSAQAAIKAAEHHVSKAQSGLKIRKSVHARNTELLAAEIAKDAAAASAHESEKDVAQDAQNPSSAAAENAGIGGVADDDEAALYEEEDPAALAISGDALEQDDGGEFEINFDYDDE